MTKCFTFGHILHYELKNVSQVVSMYISMHLYADDDVLNYLSLFNQNILKEVKKHIFVFRAAFKTREIKNKF